MVPLTQGGWYRLSYRCMPGRAMGERGWAVHTGKLDVVLAGRATWVTWLKGAVTYVVPFVVANVGILIGTRRP